MIRHFAHPMLAVFALASLIFGATPALSGTTGSLSGTVQASDTKVPIAAAKVTATSPSQSVTAITDAGGHFTFASLAPDTYTVSIEKQGFEPASQGGVSVFADQSQSLTLTAQRTLREIGRVTSRSSTDLVKPGTTADVYSINALQQQKFSGVGGGGGLNSAYSAIATVPGAYVPLNQQGYYQTVHIRGGDYDQVGYELDGVPVNRSFDNYPSGAASSLGQQELQVYTGAEPANSEAQGLAGFINQVIRTGTYPGSLDASLSIGGPAFYHKTAIELGGATKNRNFSYYVGLGGYNQDFRYVDQGNGQAQRPWGLIANTVGSQLSAPERAAFCADPVHGNSFFTCYANGTAAPAGFVTTSTEFSNVATIISRDNVFNFHVGIPHRNGSKDDVQLLFVNNFLRTQYFSSPNDLGPVALQGQPVLISDSYAYTRAPGTFLPANASSLIVPYFYPDISRHAFQAPLQFDNRDSYQNNQSIVKLQYQKNFSSNAYFRLYGYTYYSDWLQNGASYAGIANAGSSATTTPSRQYILASHTRGISGTFADQINAQNLVQFQGAYTTATSLRNNNRQMNNNAGSRSLFATLVDPATPTSGLCYAIPDAGTVAAPAVCDPGAPAGIRSSYLSLPQVAGAAGQKPIPTINGLTCGSGPCQWYVVENGQQATYNTVKPKFYSASLTDIIKPNDKLTVNLGLRYNLYQFEGSDTTGTAARALFFNAFNLDNCVNTQSGMPVYKPSAPLNLKVTDPCPAKLGFTTPVLQNIPSQVNTYPVFEPRLGLAYSLSPDSVVRASYGRFSQAPNAAFQQYNSLQQNLPAGGGLLRNFYAFGFTTPGHLVLPEVSNNYDISLEHHFKGTDLSFKLTPFYRYTQNQIQQFFLDQPSGFVSGLNAGRLTSRGVEFQMNKGDFGRNGFSGQLSFAYTNTYAQYNVLSNGTTVFTGINNDIANYNKYTSFCGTHFSDARCGSLRAAPANASPCFTTSGTPAACSAGTVANPYYNAPIQSLVDITGKFAPFTTVTGPIGAADVSYNLPYVSTLVVQYKKGPLAFTPSVQFAGGQRYGVPETSAGIDPAGGCSTLAGSVAGDPRYPYGAAGGSPYNAATCAATIAAIPNPYTHRFDGIGDFVEPNQLVANMQISYQASKNVSLVTTFANILNNCFGGSNVPWATGGSNACNYGLVSFGNAQPYFGNVFNPGSVVDPVVQFPYQRGFGGYNTFTSGAQIKNPFGVFVDARIKI